VITFGDSHYNSIAAYGRNLRFPHTPSSNGAHVAETTGKVRILI
jgi:hypothetical protein